MPFVIVIHNGAQTEYYAGKTYIYQGSIFPYYTSAGEAKRYTSRKRSRQAEQKNRW